MFPTYLTFLEQQWKLIMPENVSNMFDSADFSVGSLRISGNLFCQEMFPTCLTFLEYEWKLIMPGDVSNMFDSADFIAGSLRIST